MTHELPGHTISDDMVEINWQAWPSETRLSKAHYDEFALRGLAPPQPVALGFRVQLLCREGQWERGRVPVCGLFKRGSQVPAVLLSAQQAPTAAHSH
jgi:hypothetical protein